MSKAVFDYTFALLLLILFSVIILIGFIIASIDTKSNGFFFQTRVGKNGRPFKIIKLKTIDPITNTSSKYGMFLRKTKWDELPQLWNVLCGEMSFVGPRPDLFGYYDKLTGESRKILELKPGITSEAALKYANEEELLSKQKNPKEFNDLALFPDKVKMNLDYYYNHTFSRDLKIILKTVLPGFNK